MVLRLTATSVSQRSGVRNATSTTMTTTRRHRRARGIPFGIYYIRKCTHSLLYYDIALFCHRSLAVAAGACKVQTCVHKRILRVHTRVASDAADERSPQPIALLSESVSERALTANTRTRTHTNSTRRIAHLRRNFVVCM